MSNIWDFLIFIDYTNDVEKQYITLSHALISRIFGLPDSINLITERKTQSVNTLNVFCKWTNGIYSESI